MEFVVYYYISSCYHASIGKKNTHNFSRHNTPPDIQKMQHHLWMRCKAFVPIDVDDSFVVPVSNIYVLFTYIIAKSVITVRVSADIKDTST